MNYDRPQDSLRAGFDSYYGQYHIFHEWTKAEDLHNYVKENIEMSQELDKGKSLIGSAASGEGLVNVYRGTGKVLLAPVTRGIA